VPNERLADRTPLRLVSTAPNLTEILFALGLDTQVVGVTHGSDYPPAAAAKPKIGTFWQPNLEAIIATRPDLVVTLSFQQQRTLAERLQRIGYNCLSLDIWTVDDLLHAVATMGRVANKEDEAQRLLSDMTRRIDLVQKRLAGREKTKVLWVVQREPLRVAGRNTFVNELIELAGGENAIAPTLHKYPPIGGEQVLACGAEVIIEPAMMSERVDSQQAQARAYWQRFPGLPAVSNGRLHVIDGDIVSRLGPRLPQGIEMIARHLHPDLFGE
jgi:iron complex transport system substrate-binding protein